MYKTLNSKLVLIFIVFIISVMATVGIFLMNSVFSFYTDEFVSQVDEGFSDTVVKQLTDALQYDDFASSQIRAEAIIYLTKTQKCLQAPIPTQKTSK